MMESRERRKPQRSIKASGEEQQQLCQHPEITVFSPRLVKSREDLCKQMEKELQHHPESFNKEGNSKQNEGSSSKAQPPERNDNDWSGCNVDEQ